MREIQYKYSITTRESEIGNL